MNPVIKYGGIIAIVVVVLAFVADYKNSTENLKPPVVQNADQQVAGEATTTNESQPDQETLRVVEIIEDDTIKLSNGMIITYAGIDMKDIVNPEGSGFCLREEISTMHKSLIAGKQVTIETVRHGDVNSATSFVFLTDGTFVNEALVDAGFAKVIPAEDNNYQQRLQTAEQQAKSNRQGIWSDVCIEKKDDNVKVNINQKVKTNEAINSRTKINIKN